MLQYTVLVSKYRTDRPVTEDSSVDNDTGAETLLDDLAHKYLYNSMQEDYGGDIIILSSPKCYVDEQMSVAISIPKCSQRAKSSLAVLT